MATLVAVAAFVASKAAGGVSIGGVKDSLLSLLDSNNDGAHITLPVRLSALPALTPDIVWPATRLTNRSPNAQVFGATGLIFLLHTINQCQGRGSKNFMADIIEAGLAVHLMTIVAGVLNGGTIASTLLLSNAQYFSVIAVWYLTNIKIADAFNPWNSVLDALDGPAAGAIHKLLELSTTLVVTGAIIAAATRGADENRHAGFQFAPLVKAVIVGTATAAIPSSISSAGEAGSRALLIGLLVSTAGEPRSLLAKYLCRRSSSLGHESDGDAGLTELPFNIDSPYGASTVLEPLGLDLNQAILLVTTVVTLFGGQIAALGVPMDLPQQAAGLLNKVLNLP